VSPQNDSISEPQTSTETEVLAGGQRALVPQSDIKTLKEVDRERQNSILWKKNHKWKVSQLFLLDCNATLVSEKISTKSIRHLILSRTNNLSCCILKLV